MAQVEKGQRGWWQRPAFWQHFHLTRVVVWAVLIPIALLTSLKNSVPFLVLVSLLAPLLSDLASWRVDKNEDDRDDPPTCDEIAAAVFDRLTDGEYWRSPLDEPT